MGWLIPVVALCQGEHVQPEKSCLELDREAGMGLGQGRELQGWF